MKQVMENPGKQFYVHLKEFLKELNGTFPEDDELKMITSSILIFCMDDDEQIVVKEFYSILSPLEHLIVYRNDDFFTLDQTYWKQRSNEYALFTKLTYYWGHLNENNRKIVWDYIQIVYKLSKDFNEHLN